MTLVWFCQNLGGLASGVLVYMFIDGYCVGLLFALALPAAILATVLAARGDLPEQPVHATKKRWAKFMSSPLLFSLAMGMAAGAFMIAISAVMFTPAQQQMTSISVILGLLVASFIVLPRTLARANLFMFVNAAAYLDISGILGYYYTAGPGCVPGGPDFPYSYYIAVTGIVGTAAGCIGALLFQSINSWSFRSAFCLATLVQVIAAVFDLVIVNRWNILYGISDQAAYLFGDATCQKLAQMFAVMPGVLLMSRLCPRGAESTVYAILAGFHNLGANIAAMLGVWLTAALGIKTVGNVQTSTDCDFSGLSLAIIIAHFALPLVCLPLTLWLVPTARLDDSEVFELASPAPSFASPCSSPRGSSLSDPPTPPSPWGQEEEFYLALPGPEGLDAAGDKRDKRSFVLSGFVEGIDQQQEGVAGTH